MKEPDVHKFKEAMQKEADNQMNNGNNFTIEHKSKILKDAPAVWQMRRKRDIKTQKVKKYKAQLNVDGSRMQKGLHYKQTYALVASWTSIRLLLTLTAVHNWYTEQMYYVLSFPRTPIKDMELYLKIPQGIQVPEEDNKNKLVCTKAT